MGCKGRISLNLKCLWRCINDGLPLAFAFPLLSRLLLLPKAPGDTIGFNGHVPGKIALKIQLRHSVATCLEIIIAFEALGDGPFSVEVNVLPIFILLFKRCPSPL